MAFSSNDLQNSFIFTTVPEFIDPVLAKTRPKRSFSVIENDVFAKTGSINSGTDYL